MYVLKDRPCQQVAMSPLLGPLWGSCQHCARHPGQLTLECVQETVDSFKKTMPLIMDLRNPAMRPRHWATLMEVVGTTFDPAGPAFTLDSVVRLHLDQHADLIADLSSNASKELAIEMSIQARRCHLSHLLDLRSVSLSQLL